VNIKVSKLYCVACDRREFKDCSNWRLCIQWASATQTKVEFQVATTVSVSFTAFYSSAEQNWDTVIYFLHQLSLLHCLAY